MWHLDEDVDDADAESENNTNRKILLFVHLNDFLQECRQIEIVLNLYLRKYSSKSLEISHRGCDR